MLITTAQREMRSAFLGGFVGQLVTALIWAASAAIGLYGPGVFSLGGWLSALVLSAFAIVGRQVVLREEGRALRLAHEHV